MAQAEDELDRLLASNSLHGEEACGWRTRAARAMAMAGGFATDPRAMAVVDRAASDLRSSEVQTALDSLEWIQAKFGSFPTSDSGETAFRMLAGVPAEPWDSHERHVYRAVMRSSDHSDITRQIGGAPSEEMRHTLVDFMLEVVVPLLDSDYCGDRACPHCAPPQ